MGLFEKNENNGICYLKKIIYEKLKKTLNKNLIQAKAMMIFCRISLMPQKSPVSALEHPL